MGSSGESSAENVLKSYLNEHGPTPRPDVPVEDWVVTSTHSVEVFSPRRGLFGSAKGVAVVYLPSHDPAVVVETWVAANADWLAELSRSAITRRIAANYDDEWVEAWKGCAAEYGIEPHQKAPEDADKDPLRECPKCGEEIRARRFARHLQECS
jgi:hypothetical protein